MKVYEVTECLDKTCLTILSKATISLLVEKAQEDGLKFIAEQIAVSKSIAERYWRTLEAPDIFWDDDLMRPMIWKEAQKGSQRPSGVNIWPIWTLEDALDWIRGAGHQFVSVYSYRSDTHVEAYFTYGRHDKLVRIDSTSLILALLLFIDRALKGEYEEKEKP